MRHCSLVTTHKRRPSISASDYSHWQLNERNSAQLHNITGVLIIHRLHSVDHEQVWGAIFNLGTKSVTGDVKVRTDDYIHLLSSCDMNKHVQLWQMQNYGLVELWNVVIHCLWMDTIDAIFSGPEDSGLRRIWIGIHYTSTEKAGCLSRNYWRNWHMRITTLVQSSRMQLRSQDKARSSNKGVHVTSESHPPNTHFQYTCTHALTKFLV